MNCWSACASWKEKTEPFKKMLMLSKILFVVLCAMPPALHAQLYIQSGAGFQIDSGAHITIEGALHSEEDMTGDGTIVFEGSDPHFIHLNGYSVPRLVLRSDANAVLVSGLTVAKSLTLEKGLLDLGPNRLYLTEQATVQGGRLGYIKTGSSGSVTKRLDHHLSEFLLPVGTGESYTPLRLTSSGTYAGASITAAAVAGPDPHMPADSRDHLDHYWTIERKGIIGDLLAAGSYQELTGKERMLKPFLWTGKSWISSNDAAHARPGNVAMKVPEGNGHLYAMNVAAMQMRLLPNPARNVTTLLLNSNSDQYASLTITDSRGATLMKRQVKINKGANQIPIDVAAFKNGSYRVSCITSEKTETLSFLKVF